MAHKTPLIGNKNDWFLLWNEDTHNEIKVLEHTWTNTYSAYKDECRKELNETKKYYHDTLDRFKLMSDEEVNRWCYYELIKKERILGTLDDYKFCPLCGQRWKEDEDD